MCLISDVPLLQPYNSWKLPSAAFPAAWKSPSFKMGSWEVYHIIHYMLQRFQMLIKCFLIVPGTRINIVILFQNRKLRCRRICLLLCYCLTFLCFHKWSHRTLQNQESHFHLTVSFTLNPVSTKLHISRCVFIIIMHVSQTIHPSLHKLKFIDVSPIVWCCLSRVYIKQRLPNSVFCSWYFKMTSNTSN